MSQTHVIHSGSLAEMARYVGGALIGYYLGGVLGAGLVLAALAITAPIILNA